MKKIVVAGQLDKEKIADLIRKLGGDKVHIEVKGDMEAAFDMKNKLFDYYIGACNTGGGGAIAMPIAILGSSLCVTLSMPGRLCSKEEIENFVAKGKVVYGFTAQHAEQVLPMLMPLLLKD